MRSDSHTGGTVEITSTPQSLLLTFMGMHLLRKPIAVSGASIVEVFEWLDVGRSATRSLLARMTDRGMLDRHKSGRKTFYSLTEHGSAVLDDGSRRVWRAAEQSSWDGQWTTVALSVPEDTRHLRHRARSRLGWAGFGTTASGLWVTPGSRDVSAILGSDFVGADLTVMIGRAHPPTTDESLVSDAFDLDRIAQYYRVFDARWASTDVSAFDAEGAFAARIHLQADWLFVGRADPLLPATLLPHDWPADTADRLFRSLDAILGDASTEIESHGLDSIEV